MSENAEQLLARGYVNRRIHAEKLQIGDVILSGEYKGAGTFVEHSRVTMLDGRASHQLRIVTTVEPTKWRALNKTSTLCVLRHPGYEPSPETE